MTSAAKRNFIKRAAFAFTGVWCAVWSLAGASTGRDAGLVVRSQRAEVTGKMIGRNVHIPVGESQLVLGRLFISREDLLSSDGEVSAVLRIPKVALRAESVRDGNDISGAGLVRVSHPLSIKGTPVERECLAGCTDIYFTLKESKSILWGELPSALVRRATGEAIRADVE